MTAEIITIGDEILIGQTIDTNSAYIASNLDSIGFDISRIVSISDKKDAILKALNSSVQKADLIIITGGLGPTNDDITKLTLCSFFDTKLIVNESVLKNIENIILPRFGIMNELNRKQAEVPECATIINNPVGTAPLLWFEKDGKIFIALPGVPHEMEHAIDNEIMPRLKTHFKTPVIVHRKILTVGLGESFMAETLTDWEKQLSDEMKLAYLPSPGQITLRLSCKGADKQYLEKAIDSEVEKLKDIIGDSIFGYGNDTLQFVIGELLKKNNYTVSTAESCTGGNISRIITSIPGSSAYYKGSVIAYSNEVKHEKLNVASDALDNFGAVSQPVVEQMAQGVRKLLDTDFAIATSGIAGPDGATPGKPVGTVWIAVAGKDKTISKKYNFGNNRDRNIIRSSIMGIEMLRQILIR